MKTYEIDAWALRVIERIEQQQPNEDSRVELKAEWPDKPERAARQIAGHANAMRGESILWLIGVDEEQGVKGASQNNLANWWPQVKAQFDNLAPDVREVSIPCKDNKTVVALYFETDRIPFVVKNSFYGKKNGGPVQLEVPWREGTAVRSATHSDLIQLLSPLQRPILNIEVGKGRGFCNKCPLRPQVSLSGRTAHSPPQPTAAIYLRVKVVNRGRRTARNCHGYLADVEVWREEAFCETSYADYLRLAWSYRPSASLDLLPDVPHWLDLISTREHDRSFFLETDPKATLYERGFDETNVYRLTIIIFAEDAEPAQTFVFLHWGGYWNSIDVFDETEWESRKLR